MTARFALPTPLRRGAALCAVAAATALVAAGPAVATKASPAADARAVFAELAEAVASDDSATPQGPSQPLLRAPEARAMQAVTASGAFYDAIGDESIAPDLQRMLPSTSDDGRYSVAISLNSNALIYGDYVASFVNTDGNALTGSPTFGGADVAVTIVGESGPDAVGAARWAGGSFQVVHLPSLVSFPSGKTDEVWSVSAAELGVGPGARTTLAFGSMYAGAYDDYFDFAPEPGLAPFAFTAGALAPPPPSPAPAPAPAAAPAASPSPRSLAVRGFGLTGLPGAVRVRIGWVRATGRVTWRVRLTGRVDGRRVATSVRGSGRAGTRTVARTLPLQRRWSGTRVSGQLVVKDASSVVVHTRTTRIPRRAR